MIYNSRYPEDLIAKLNSFAHRSMTQGEIFVLSKVLADSLPLTDRDEASFNTFVASKKSVILEVIYELNNFSYSDEDTVKLIIRQIEELVAWRHAIAYNPPALILTGNPDTVIDEFTSITRIVDSSGLCALTDVADRATYLYDMFKSFATIVFSNNADKPN